MWVNLRLYLAGRAAVALVLLVGVSHVLAQDPNICDEPGDEPDVIVGAIFDVRSWGRVDDIHAFSFGTESCNIGTCWLNWFAQTPDHPVIAQNMFRLKDGRFEQIGQSWLKHGFFALSNFLCFNDCLATAGQHLGVHCSDPYSSSLNGFQLGLGPKFEVNPSTGVFPYPPSGGDGGSDLIYRRLQVRTADLEPALNDGALYFFEGQYVAADDAAAGNQNNNASYRQVEVTADGTGFAIGLTGATVQTKPGILAWQAHEPSVFVEYVDVPNDGRLIVGSKVTDLGDGFWAYEYAVQNLNSHRAAGSIEVPIPPL